MPDLVERVTTALRNPGDSPWLPGLATGLAERSWNDLYHDIGLTPTEYGTARIMASDCRAPREIVSVVPAALSGKDSTQVFQIELLGKDTARRYEESGVKFYSEDEINEERMTERVVEALNILKSIPTLFTTVAELVRSVHLIDASDDDYDVSFSEPDIPFSIFISVPKARSITNTLRVAEAIVHEAMHLQLTLIEQTVPLVRLGDKRYFSPWKGEYRSPQGVLHALYVFRVIYIFLKSLTSLPMFLDGRAAHISKRHNQIATEIEQVKSFQDCLDLTPYGFKFVQSLLAE